MAIRKDPLAHRYVFNGVVHKQLLADHLEQVSMKAYRLGLQINFPYTLKLLGYAHDLGKYADAFQEKIDPDLRDPTYKECSFDHPLAGAYILYHLIHKKDKKTGRRSYSKRLNLFSAMITLPIIAHHLGLPDLSLTDYDEYKKLMEETPDPAYQIPEIKEWLSQQSFFRDFQQSYKRAWEECNTFFDKAKKTSEQAKNTIVGDRENDEPFGIILSYVLRGITGMLISADSEDTAEDANDFKVIPDNGRSLAYREMLKNLDDHVECLSKKSMSIFSHYRSGIYKESRDAGGRNEPGIYRLAAPVGSGKTFASMAFALNHAIQHEKREILYVVPYVSIVTQNCEEIRQAVSEPNTKPWIIERDSLLSMDDFLRGQSDIRRKQLELSVSSLNAPVTFTTMYQFESALMNGNYANYRSMASLINSVIIIDEIQMVELKKYHLLTLWLNILTQFFCCTVLICTATVPEFEKVLKHKICYAKTPDIISNADELRRVFNRVMIHNITDHKYDVDGLAELVQDKLTKTGLPNALLIVNTKRESEECYDLLSKNPNLIVMRFNANGTIYAKRIIEEIKEHIERSRTGEEKFVLVATSIVEAGVDISFSVGFCTMTSLVSLEQISGRVNRHGEYGALSDLYILRKPGGMDRPKNNAFYELWLKRRVTEECIQRISSSGIPASEFFSKKQYNSYYSMLLKACRGLGDYLDYPCIDGSLVLLLNQWFLSKEPTSDQTPISSVKFRKIFETYKVIESNTIQVLCDTTESHSYIENMKNGTEYSPFQKVIIRNSISVSDWKLHQLIEDHLVSKISGIFVLDPSCMDRYGAIIG